MDRTYDVIVVGARCAGSPLAALLARRGVNVGVVERATFPKDTLSTHIFQAHAISFLDRLGVIDELVATGAPYTNVVDVRQGDVRFVHPFAQQPGDLGGALSVRRPLLDAILARAAEQAGADVQMATTVTDLITENGRVAGVRMRRNGSEAELGARLVVGADGRNSTVAKLVGARKYNATPGERFGYWTFFEGAHWNPDAPFVFHRWDDRFVIACPTDSGLYQVIAIPDRSELPRFRADLEGSFMEYANSCEPVAQALEGARRVGKFFGMVRWEGFFREGAGPGWVLVGDAGYFKDPAPGQGIGDAFLQVDRLAPVISSGLRGSDEELDRVLADWWRWRDKDAAEHYWFATDQGKGGQLLQPIPEIVRRMVAKGQMDGFFNILAHRARPKEVMTAPKLLGATGRMLVRRGCDRRALLRDVGTLIADGARHDRLTRKPQYVEVGASADAGETEVDA
jgi:2-polyprenyl-6-methoxyphenol hydroxylase-like FAD-dependent oxidoreductase